MATVNIRRDVEDKFYVSRDKSVSQKQREAGGILSDFDTSVSTIACEGWSRVKAERIAIILEANLVAIQDAGPSDQD